jgi:hypothetical protein
LGLASFLAHRGTRFTPRRRSRHTLTASLRGFPPNRTDSDINRESVGEATHSVPGPKYVRRSRSPTLSTCNLEHIVCRVHVTCTNTCSIPGTHPRATQWRNRNDGVVVRRRNAFTLRLPLLSGLSCTTRLPCEPEPHEPLSPAPILVALPHLSFHVRMCTAITNRISQSY